MCCSSLSIYYEPLRFVVLSLALLAFQARADTFDWAYTLVASNAGPNHQNLEADASGTMTTTSTEVNGALLITEITGSRTTNYWMGYFLNPPETDQIVGLVPPGVITQNPPDNLLYPNSSTPFDRAGFAFQLNCTYCGSMGIGGIVGIGGIDGTYFEIGGTGIPGAVSSFTLSRVAVPEPAPIALFALVTCAALLIRQRRASRERMLRP